MFVPERKTRSLWLPAQIAAVATVGGFQARMRGETQPVGFSVGDVAQAK